MCNWEHHSDRRYIKSLGGCIGFSVSVLKLLLVDDDDAVRITLGSVLKHHGFSVIAVSNVPDALELVSNQRFDVLLADFNVGQPGDGFTVVSAMRRVQPDACTFILTGYPDFESAIQAMKAQVDEYFSKPLDVEELVAAISSARSGKRPAPKVSPTRKMSQILRELSPQICQRWLRGVLSDPEIAALPLTEAQRSDHIPDLLENVIRRLEGGSDEMSLEGAEAARKHGRIRYQQGYTIPQMLYEARVLQRVMSSTIRENLFNIDLSSLVPDILQIGESLQADVELSIRVYQSQIPRSLQSSFSMLYQSPYLGVMIADESRLIDANEALLKMIGHGRDELAAGAIDWREMTPEKFRLLDMTALEQLREFGTCVPYEKEYVLPDGSSVPFLIGGVRLGLDPFQWSAYVVNLTEQRKLHAADRKLKAWETRYKLINLLAHELNNPLAAMTFTLHILRTQKDMSEDTVKLLDDSVAMLDRIGTTVRRVLVESSDEATF
jgi:ActR/RegA family two-component response regulator/PAS domain-containing protein